MKPRILTAIMIISEMLLYTNGLLACPVAILTGSPSQTLVGNNVSLDGSLSYSTGGCPTIIQYKWDFHYDDANFHLERTTSTATTNYSYSQPGAYTVALKVVSCNGDSFITTNSRFPVNVTAEIRNNNKLYSTIQAAINDAQDSEVIVVDPGVYNENINFSNITAQNVTVRSTDPCNWDVVRRTIINAGDANIDTVTFQGYCNAVLAGFKITGGLRGIKCDNASPTIKNCIIMGNGQISSLGGGVYCNSAYQPLITNCFIVDNTAYNGAGIYNDISSPVIRNCVISKNTAVQNGGGLYNNNSAPTLWNCTIVNNTAGSGGGMYSDSAAGEMWFRNCIFWYNSASNQGNEICNSSSASPIFGNCNISGSGGSLNWKDEIGANCGNGGIDSSPFFKPIQCVEEGLAGYWKLDETSGVVANDSAGTNNGTLYGGQGWTSGVIQGGLSFDGVDDYVDCGSGPSNYDNITVSVWMKTSTKGALVSNRYSVGGYGTWYTLTSTSIEIGDNSQGGFRNLTFYTPTLDGLWHHVVYTKDGVNHAIYVDGSLDQSFTSNADISQNSPLFIGRRWTGSSNYPPYWFNGTIDDVRIYNRALTASEVSELYKYGVFEQYRCCLNRNSPCRNAGLAGVTVSDVGEYDIDNEIRIREGRVDIGADEYVVPEFPYICSFESYQGFQNMSNGTGDWIGNATMHNVSFYTSGTTYPYQCAAIAPNHTLYRQFVSKETDNSHVRVSCIPSPGSYVNIRQDDVNIASVRFGTDDKIYVLNKGSYENTNINYKDIADKCRTFLINTDPGLNGYSYENTWIELEFIFNWQNWHYDVHWQYYDSLSGSSISASIKTGAAMLGQYSTFSEIGFQTDISATVNFELNRVSISNKASSGGNFGPNQDIWITSPETSLENPLHGSYDIKGSLWYDKLGRYEIKICPTDQTPDEIITKNGRTSDNWLLVHEGTSIVDNDILGFLSTAKFFNGNYYVRIFLYDDLNRLQNPLVVTGNPDAWRAGCVTRSVHYNGQDHQVAVEYPIVGRYKKSYHFEEKPDVSINWPGSFPFEFKRIYDSSRRKQLYPLFFGWTHNNDIHVMESTTNDFETDEQNYPSRDAHGLGIGRLYLLLPNGGQSFRGHVDELDPTTVVYLPDDNSPVLIKRTSVVHSSSGLFEVTYTYYSPDGIKYTFEKTDNDLPYSPPANNEGVVGWSTYIGIDSQEDRFNNALVYTWDGDERFLTEIQSKVGNYFGVKIKLDIGHLNNWQDGPELYKSISVQYGSTVINCYNFDVKFQSFVTYLGGCDWYSDYGYSCSGDCSTDCDWGAVYQVSDDPVETNSKTKYYFHKHYGDAGFILDRAPEFMGFSNDAPYHEVLVGLNFDKDGSLQEKWISMDNEWTPIGDFFIERYSNDYDEQGNLVSTTEFFNSDFYANRYKICKTVSTPTGAVLSQKYLVYPVTEAYHPIAGDGAVCDVNYLYEDSRFPLKPTTIMEYFDDDGDTIYDSPPRMTKMVYDNDGNMVRKRVYADADNFVLTEYDYHPKYNFPTRVTTWKDYCTESGGQIVYPADSNKVEQRSVYGDADGTVNPNGAYLVQQKKLLGVSNGNLDWAVTKYTYYEKTGQPKTVESPRTSGKGSYYHCDDTTGLLTKVWDGVNIASGEPTTATTPQKRYFYDGLGRTELEGDNLGQVKLYTYDNTSFVTSVKVFEDSTAMSPANAFVTSLYSGRNDFVKLKLFTAYDSHNNCTIETLETGGELHHLNWHNGKYPILAYGCTGDYFKGEAHLRGMIYPYPYPNGQIRWTGVVGDGGYNAQNGPIDQEFYYDPMDRLNHVVTWDASKRGDADYPFFYKIEDYNYYGSGKLKNEKTYNVVSDYSAAPTYTLEKNVNYFYDGLDRLIKKVEDPCDHPELGLNITVQYGYDAAGNQIYTVDPKGSIIFTDYDQANRKVREYFAKPVVYYTGTTNVDVASSMNNRVKKTEVEYFADDKVKSVTHYDWDGMYVLSKTAFTYDDRARLESVSEDIQQGQDPAVTTYDYRDAGEEFTDARDTSGDKYHIKITDAEYKPTLIALDIYGQMKKTLYSTGHYEKIEDCLGEYVCNWYFGICRWMPTVNEVRKTTGKVDGSSQTVVNKRGLWGEITEINYPDNGHLDFDYYMVALEDYRKPWKIYDHKVAVDKPVSNPSNTLEYEYEYDFRTGNLKRYIVSENGEFDYIIDYNSMVAYPGRTRDTQVTRFTQSNPDGELIYDVNYDYDMAGRLKDVCEPLLNEHYNRIADFDYDKNGNRSQLKYYLNGSVGGDAVSIGYTYNLDNILTGFSTSDGPVFSLNATQPGDIDGLGRLKGASEIITNTSQVQIQHVLTNQYDMRSQLTFESITNVGTYYAWVSDTYSYDKAGNVQTMSANSSPPSWPASQSYTYEGDIMTQAGSLNLDWNYNGNLVSKDMGPGSTELSYNWDNKLRQGAKLPYSVNLKYDPMGNRVWKQSTVSEQTTTRKYVVDIAGGLPTILLEIDPCTSSLTKSYIYANGEILAQHDGSYTANRYFYLHDRLGSVRQILDTNGTVIKCYTFGPFGATLEEGGTLTNPFMFTGQYYDSEIGQYYLRARQYDPQLMRFTGRDSVDGKFEEPLSLHKYLYCQNEPISRIDPKGLEPYLPYGVQNYNAGQTQNIIDEALNDTSKWWSPAVWLNAFGSNGKFDYSGWWNNTFVAGGEKMGTHGISNYLLGYCAYYQGAPYGQQWTLLSGAVGAGNIYGISAFGNWLFYGGDRKLLPSDDFASRYYMAKGAFDANVEHFYGGGAQLDRLVLGAAVWGLNSLRWIDYFDNGKSCDPEW